MSDDSNRCPQCNAPLAGDAPQGLCPRCLLLGAAVPTDEPTGPHGTKIIPPAPQLDAVRAAFPQLEVLELIGRGGMGVVYKARQKSLDRLVALKLLAPERVTDSKFAERFEREAQALARLNHPNIVTIHDFGTASAPASTLNPQPSTAPLYFLLMEFVDGVNLRQAMKAGRFTPEQALAIVPPVCDALQYAHERGIVHRDIKPENLLLDKNGRVKIADFGIAKMLEPLSVFPAERSADLPIGTTTENEAKPPNRSSALQASATLHTAAGTPQYMAPEQREHHRTDHRADIYSLGVVLYELLTGELPGKRLEAPSRKVQIDVRLDEIVLRALETKPELRYQTAGEFRTQVETVASTPASRPPGELEAPSFSGIKTADAYLSTPEWLASLRGKLWIYSGKGTLTLTRDHLTFNDTKTGATTTIPLAAIRNISLGNYPRFAKPIALHYISVTWEEAGRTRCHYFTPTDRGFQPVWETNRIVLEWLQALRAAVTAAEFRTHVETVASPPGGSRRDEAPSAPAPLTPPLKSARGKFTTPEYLATPLGGFLKQQGEGELSLHTDRLIFAAGARRTMIPFSAIKQLGTARGPRWTSPAGHQYLWLDYEDGGQQRQLLFMAGTAPFRFAGETADCAAEWIEAIRVAARAGGHPPIPGLPVSPLVVPASPWIAMMVLLPMLLIALLVPLAATRELRLSPIEILLVATGPVLLIGTLAAVLTHFMKRAAQREMAPANPGSSAGGSRASQSLPPHSALRNPKSEMDHSLPTSPASVRITFAAVVTFFYSGAGLVALFNILRIGVLEGLLVGALAGVILWKFNLLPRLTHAQFRRGLSWVAFALSLPALAMGGFFLTQLPAEWGNWNPGPAEVVFIPLVFLAVLLLPWAGVILWHAACDQSPPPHSALRNPKSEMDQSLLTLAAASRLWHAPAFVLVLLYGALLVFVSATVPDLPQRMAIHFNSDGEADNWAGRSTHALFIAGTPLLLTALFAALAALTTRFPKLLNIPRRDYWLAPERMRFTAALMLRWLLWLACLMTVFFGALHWIVLQANQTQPAKLSFTLLPVVIGFLIACMVWTTRLIMRLAETERYERAVRAATASENGAGSSPNRPSAGWGGRAAKGVLVIVFVLVVRTWFVGVYNIRSNALSPEIPQGSLVLVWKPVPRYGVGDLVVYRHDGRANVGRVTETQPDAVRVNRNGAADFNIARHDLSGRVISVLWRGTASNSQLTAKTPSFGPVIERVLPNPESGVACLLDFETGQFVTPPADLAEKLKRGIADIGDEAVHWLRGSGADAAVTMPNQSSLRLFEGAALSLAINQAPALTFDQFTPADVAQVFGGASWERSRRFDNSGRIYYGTPATTPTALAFITREGATGVLEILGPSTNPDGVKIRYKLITGSLGTTNSLPSPAAVESARTNLAAAPELQFRLVARDRDFQTPVDVLRYFDDTAGTSWRVEKEVLMGGDALAEARLVPKRGNGPWRFELRLTPAGAARFAEITRRNIGRQLAIVFEDKILTTPFIQSEITGGRAQIAGSFTEPEVVDLVWRLNHPTTASEAASAVTEFTLRFNPEIPIAGQPALLDLDKGLLLPWPAESGDWSERKMGQWIEESGADLLAAAPMPNLRLGSFATKLARVDDAVWATPGSRAELLAALNPPAPDANPQRDENLSEMHDELKAIALDGSLPMTFVFRTAGGSVGVMQVTGVDDNGRSVNIRSKQVAPAGQPEIPSATVDQKFKPDVPSRSLRHPPIPPSQQLKQ